MLLGADDLEIAAFIGLIIIFEVGERFWPARPVNRFLDLKLDILSFVFALTVNRLCTWAIRSFVGEVGPPVFANQIRYLQGLPSVIKIVLALFIVDFIIYWIHRAQHHFNAMWRTHAWHHSIEQMYWFSGFRTSFFHSFIYNIPQVVIPVVLLRLSPAAAAIGYSLGLLIQFWEHTNLKVRLGPLLGWFLVTPEYHRIHHSATLNRGKNLGTTFSVWDRMFGTYVDPASVTEQFPLGLGETVAPREIPRMLLGL